MVTGAIVHIQNDGIAFSTCSADNRTAVIGGTTVGDVAGDFTVVIHHASDRQIFGIRWGGIHHEIKAVGRIAFVTRFVSFRHSDAVRAITQFSLWREAPCTVFINDSGTNNFIAIFNGNSVTRFAFTGKGRGLIISFITRFDSAGDITFVINNTT